MNYTILIIDDDETTHDVLGAYLALTGYGVLNSYNGVEGLAMLREKTPDLILLDLQMPEMDGFQMLEQVRRDRQLADIPILILSSLNRSYLKIKALEMGADDYITKPFDRAEILARVKAALRRSGRFTRNNAALSGDMTAITIAELLQTMELGKRTCTIGLPDIPARISMAAGAVTLIEQGAFSGTAAMQRIMMLERGKFEVTMSDLPLATDVQSIGVNSLLLDSLTCLDQLGRTIGPLLGVPYQVDSISAESSFSTHLAEILPLPLKDFLCLLEGDLHQNSALIMHEIDTHLIQISNSSISVK